jgi:hypothetical protein
LLISYIMSFEEKLRYQSGENISDIISQWDFYCRAVRFEFINSEEELINNSSGGDWYSRFFQESISTEQQFDSSGSPTASVSSNSLTEANIYSYANADHPALYTRPVGCDASTQTHIIDGGRSNTVYTVDNINSLPIYDSNRLELLLAAGIFIGISIGFWTSVWIYFNSGVDSSDLSDSSN